MGEAWVIPGHGLLGAHVRRDIRCALLLAGGLLSTLPTTLMLSLLLLSLIHISQGIVR